jgi:hypothetical protein
MEQASRFFELFRERNLDSYIFDHTNKDGDFGSFMSLLVFIEKDGRPNNYLETFNDVAKEFFDKYTKEHQKYLNHLEHDRQKKVHAEETERNRREGIASQELKYLNHNEVPNPDEKNKPFRYLRKKMFKC